MPGADDIKRVVAELVGLRESAEANASRQLLPALASSLSYENWLQWKREQGQGHEVAIAGVPVEELLHQSEQQVKTDWLKHWGFLQGAHRFPCERLLLSFSHTHTRMHARAVFIGSKEHSVPRH